MQFINIGLFDIHGNLMEIQSVGRDVTDRKRAEKALRESLAKTEFLADIIEKTEQPLGIGYPDGRLGFCEDDEASEIVATRKAEMIRCAEVLGVGEVVAAWLMLRWNRRPEVAIGLGIPRPPIQLVGDPEHPRVFDLSRGVAMRPSAGGGQLVDLRDLERAEDGEQHRRADGQVDAGGEENEGHARGQDPEGSRLNGDVHEVGPLQEARGEVGERPQHQGQEPDAERPFRAWGFPLTGYVCAAGWLVVALRGRKTVRPAGSGEAAAAARRALEEDRANAGAWVDLATAAPPHRGGEPPSIVGPPLNDHDRKHLRAVLDAAPVLTEVTFDRPASNGRRARTVHQHIKAVRVTLKAPLRPDRTLPDITVTALLATEVNPPADEDPLDWLLLTNLPVDNPEQAIEKLSWYLCRWQIEIYFRILKSGCRIEKLQLEKLERLEPALAFYMIVAWRVLLKWLQLGSSVR